MLFIMLTAISLIGIMCFLDRQEANTVPKETLIGNLPHGAEVTARIVEIDFGTMRLRLSSKSGVLAENARWEDEYLRQNDEFYHVLSDREQAEIDAAKRVRIALLPILQYNRLPGRLMQCNCSASEPISICEHGCLGGKRPCSIHAVISHMNPRMLCVGEAQAAHHSE